MLGVPIVGMVARTITCLCSDQSRELVVAANWLDRCTAGSAFPLFLSTVGAALSDLWIKDPDRMAMPTAGAKMAGIVGVAVSLGPTCGALIMTRTGNPKFVAGTAAALSVVHLLYLLASTEETLPKEQ